jgi:hypothetical protein
MKVSIHTVYGLIFKIWRKKRMDLFIETIDPRPNEVLLDVGGYPSTWMNRPQMVKRTDCLNIHPIEWSEEAAPQHHITAVLGDGCALKYDDRSYDIVFSNSVIEHVGDWNSQRAFASELSRVGKKLWIQTAAFECPLEPHFLAPFVHWLPVPIRKFCVRWLTPWGWITRPSKAQVNDQILHTRLLTKNQMKELFPDCRIWTERLLGMFPKSYIAYRTGSKQVIGGDGGQVLLSQP